MLRACTYIDNPVCNNGQEKLSVRHITSIQRSRIINAGRTHVRFARCTGYILNASLRYQTGFQVIFKIYGQVTSSRDEIGNFFSAMRKPWPFSTFLTNIFSKIIFMCCGKDIHHVVMLIEISVCTRTQSQIIPENIEPFQRAYSFSEFWSYLSVHLSYDWHDFWEKN